VAERLHRTLVSAVTRGEPVKRPFAGRVTRPVRSITPLKIRRPSGRAARALATGIATALGAAVAVPGTAAAQTPPPGARGTVPPAPVEVDECFGFAFGEWKPALSWRGAGHGADAPTVRLSGEFAARDSATGESELLLFPSWWPAGVGVRFARPPRMPGDTVSGVARAFVADRRLPTPSTAVRAWRTPCGGTAHPRQPSPREESNRARREP
jgi:hypothetical protein